MEADVSVMVEGYEAVEPAGTQANHNGKQRPGHDWQLADDPWAEYIFHGKQTKTPKAFIYAEFFQPANLRQVGSHWF